MVNRPSIREINRKLKLAKHHSERIDENGVLFIDQDKFVINLDELGLTIEDVVHEGFLKGIINDLDPNDYAGSRPPQVSYERTTEGLELWAFQFTCTFLDSVIGRNSPEQYYFKFCVTTDNLWLCSLHYHREKS